MRLVLPVLILITIAAPAAAQQPADAYADATAAALVRDARARRLLIDRRIEAYETTARERMSVALSAGIAERLLFRRESVSRIHWTPDTVRIDILAAREVLPPVQGAPQIPAGLSGYMPVLAFDPVDSEMLLRFDSTVIRHPLASGSEQHYRFAAGDSTVIQLPGGRVVRLRELRIQPRRRSPRLISGSFWLDMDTHAVVQAYFRLSKGFEESDGGGPPFLRPMRAEIDYVAIEYGLWELRWWLPRIVAATGVFQAGRLRMPLEYHRRYEDYSVTGDTAAALPVADDALLAERPCRPRGSFTVNVSVGTSSDGATEARADSALQRRARADSARARRSAVQQDTARVCDRPFIVTRQPDSLMMSSAHLPAEIYSDDEPLISDEELRSIVDRVRDLPVPPWRLGRPVVQLPHQGPGLLRYNRVEGLSLGVRALMDLGIAAADAELRFATGPRELFGEVGVARAGQRLDTRLAAYRRVGVVDISTQPFSLGSSAAALLLGRDDADYFQATGGEVILRPPVARSQGYELRLFAEAQRALARVTDFSAMNLIDSDRTFRDNLAAQPAEQIGASLRLVTSGGYDPGALRWGAEAVLHGETGDYRFLRPSARMRATRPLLPRLWLGAEAAAGTTLGSAPVQRRWQIGGAATLRGYGAAAITGDTYWRGRAEIGAGLPLVRLAFFGDAGWAGARDDLTAGRPLRSVGIGLGFLDGMLRFDVARGIDAPRSWRVHMQMDGVM